jgi:hypothetical protein
MMGATHSELCKIAEKWLLKAKGCGFALVELCALGENGETPDAIGWRNGYSILVECKTSRADFHSDKKKPFRKMPVLGMGTYRFYMCPAGVIQPADLPEGWGLVWVSETGKAIQKVGPKGNCWYGKNAEPFKFSEKCMKSEQAMMTSALRRLHLRGVLPLIYDSPVDNN